MSESDLPPVVVPIDVVLATTYVVTAICNTFLFIFFEEFFAQIEVVFNKKFLARKILIRNWSERSPNVPRTDPERIPKWLHDLSTPCLKYSASRLCRAADCFL